MCCGGSGGGGGGMSKNGDAGQPGEVVREANKANRGISLQEAINSGSVSAQNLPGGATQLTHAKATVRYSASGAEVWSSRSGEKAFKPSAPVISYKDRIEGVKEFARRAGIKL